MNSYDEEIRAALSHPVVFNAVFENTKLLAAFLNATGYFNVDPNTITVLNSKSYDGIEIKTPDMDVKIKIEDNTYLNLEMQNQKPSYDMLTRLNYYLGKLISKSQPKGRGYQKNYSIVFAIFNYTLFSNDDNYIRRFQMTDEYHNVIEDSKIYIIELTKLNNCDKNELKKWLLIFNEKNLKTLKEQDGIMNDLAREVIRLNHDKELLSAIDAYEKQERDFISELEAREAKGLEKGRTEGLAQGLEKGRTEGLKEGQTSERLANAKKMKELGVAVEIIMQVTGLTKEEIEKL